MSIYTKAKRFNPDLHLNADYIFLTRVAKTVAVDADRVNYVSHVAEPTAADRLFVGGVSYDDMAAQLRAAGYRLTSGAKLNSSGKHRGGNASIPSATEIWKKGAAE